MQDSALIADGTTASATPHRAAVEELASPRSLRAFINLPWSLYRGDPNWVPPLKGQLMRTLLGRKNPLLAKWPHAFLLARQDGKAVGRLLVGINGDLNQATGKSDGYFSLFESIDDAGVAAALFGAAQAWLRVRGMTSLVGPISPTNGDDGRGILVRGFDGPPVLMNNYNPPFYEHLIEGQGFSKDMDWLAYRLEPSRLDPDRYGRAVEYAMKKYGFRIDRIDPKQYDRETRDLKTIIDAATPDSWTHVTRPTMEDVRRMADSLRTLMDDDLVYIARSGEEPIGFVAALPDYSPVFRKMNGRLFPFGIIYLLRAKRYIRGVRVMMQFVVPRFQHKAVNSAIFHRLMLAGQAKGYTYGEGSTVAEWNTDSIRSVENAGGQLYRIYRMYRSQWSNL